MQKDSHSQTGPGDVLAPAGWHSQSVFSRCAVPLVAAHCKPRRQFGSRIAINRSHVLGTSEHQRVVPVRRLCSVVGSVALQTTMTKGFKISNQQVMDKQNAAPTNSKPALDLEEVARLQLGETPETKADSLLWLRQALAGEPSLKIPSSDDILVMFLRARKYRIQEASQMVKNYFRTRRDVPEFFHELVPEKIPFRTICHDHKLLTISPEPGENGRCMGVFNIGAWNPNICSLSDYTRAGLLLTGCWLLEDFPSICGVECVMDMKGLNIHHLTQLTPSYLVKLASIMQDCLPVRIKAVYIVNHPTIFKVIFEAIKPFLRSKLLSRVHFIGGEAPEFWDRFPRDLVPVELGGRREHFDYDRQEELVHSRSGFFESLCACGYKKNKT
ncbi:alpha-tocopherol transfer protein-like isoform X1 [Dermacentor andersoni]|uniref:alpha-tocopherol transfer protein-like isoform X1 n=1 Tax=Dermacentor andersoni TaxID=34620 RepID=UPI002417E690|nr:alpha-tocopherol transfer protein-like isoform X1 [Dermacentor andersoni]